MPVAGKQLKERQVVLLFELTLSPPPIVVLIIAAILDYLIGDPWVGFIRCDIGDFSLYANCLQTLSPSTNTAGLG